MKPCKKCGAADRNASGKCRPCQAARSATYQVAHPDRRTATTARYRATHRDPIAASNAAYYERNRERVLARTLAYYDTHLEPMRAVNAANQAGYRAKRQGAARAAVLDRQAASLAFRERLALEKVWTAWFLVPRGDGYFIGLA